MGVQEQIVRLLGLRSDLADNLTRMGVDASADEPLQTLVPKVLRILQGDTSKVAFTASLADAIPGVSFGFFLLGEVARPFPVFDVTYFNRISEVRLRFAVAPSGPGELSSLVVSAPGWVMQGGVLSHAFPTGATRFDLLDALGLVTLTSAEMLRIRMTMEATGADGSAIAAPGVTEISWARTTWGMLEAYGRTWGEWEAACPTWGDWENVPKPPVQSRT